MLVGDQVPSEMPLDFRIESSVWHFETQQPSDAPSVVRTQGVVVRGVRDAPAAEPAPPDRIGGKVLRLGGPTGSDLSMVCTAVESGNADTVIACGNATAAGLAVSAREGARPGEPFTRTLRLPADVRVEVRGVVRWNGAAAQVEQTWCGVPLSLRPVTVAGGRAIWQVSGGMNDYRVFRLEPDEDFGDAGVLRDVGSTLGTEDWAADVRAALVRQRAGGVEVRFLPTAGRVHPSAPLTGLAVLALLREGHPGVLGAAEHVQTPMGPMPLPALARHPSASPLFDIALPEVRVTLRGGSDRAAGADG